jgi:hypothetical protein
LKSGGHGPLQVAVPIAGALIVIYISFVTQDHLDWPAVSWFPDFAGGVHVVLAVPSRVSLVRPGSLGLDGRSVQRWLGSNGARGAITTSVERG